jgi:tripartite-type tricarboxylate transporter receptor subunit TctC
MQTDDVRKKLEPLGIEPLSMSREQFASRLRAESAKWRSLITEIGMPPLD